MKLSPILYIGLLAGVSGCATPPDDAQLIQPLEPLRTGSVTRAAVCIGLTAVDPAAYEGWDGDCPGCDVDAQGMCSLFLNNKFNFADLLQNEQATWGEVIARIQERASNLKRGDLLVIFMSGHGGQIEDDNGDEADKLDETICLWDGQVRDDLILEFLKILPAGLRIVLINDQCHSEGNFRAFIRKVQRVVTFGRYGKIKGSILIKGADSFDGQLIQFAGCRENSYSYGAADGGTWTQNLLASFKSISLDGSGTIHANSTWLQWFETARKRMPGNQVPVWVEYGSVTDAFRNGKVLQ